MSVTNIDYPNCKINITTSNKSLELASNNIKLTQSAIGNSDILIDAGQVLLTNINTSQTNNLLSNGNTLVDGNDTNQSVAGFILLKDNLNGYENDIRSTYTVLRNTAETNQHFNDCNQSQLTNYNSSSQIISRMTINSGNMTIINNTSNAVNINTDRFELINSTTTTQITPNQITINGSSGSVSQVLTKDASNNMVWANGTSSWVGTASSDLNMSSYSINNVSSINAISATDMNINGQAVFTTPPHVPEPILGNDAASKGYVDSLVGQYGGSLNLFFNYSDTASSPPADYKQLSPTITAVATTAVNKTSNNGTEVEVASFITVPLNLDSLPAGAWVGNINGHTADKNVDISYRMRVYKYTIDNSLNEIGLGATSTVINSLTTADYYCNLVVPTTPLELTDRLVVKIFILRVSGGGNATITTNFEGIYYSYVSTSLNAGTTLLTSNNVWTGSNNFQSVGITSKTPTTNTNTNDVPTTAWVNSYFALASSLASYGLIAGSNTWTGTQNFVGATLTALTQATNTNTTAVATTQWVNTWFALASSLASYGLIAGGSAWSGIQNFQSSTLSALTQLTNTNSTLVATTQWVNNWFGKIAGQTWTGTQDFTGAITSASTQATNTNNTLVATTQWVNTWFALASSLASYGLIAGGSAWSGIQNFQSSTLSALTQLTNTNSTLVATTQWVNNWFGKIAGQTWTGTQDFTGAITSASTQATNTNNTLVATTAWVNTWFALASSLASYGLIAGGSAWSGIQNFQTATLSALTQLTNTNSTAVATTQWVNNWFGLKAGQTWTGTHSFSGATSLSAPTQATNTNTTDVATTAWTNTFYAPKATATFTGTTTFATIKGSGNTGTTLGLTSAIIPSSISYDVSGTAIAGAIGLVSIGTGATNITILNNTQTNVASVAINSTGVYVVSGTITIRNTGTAGTNDRLTCNVGYGSSTSTTNSAIVTYGFSKITLGTSAVLGWQTEFPFSSIFTITTATLLSPGYFTLALSNTGTTTLSLISQASIIQAVRIA